MPNRLARNDNACSHGGCQTWRNSNTQVTSSALTAMRRQFPTGHDEERREHEEDDVGHTGWAEVIHPPACRAGVELGAEAEGGDGDHGQKRAQANNHGGSQADRCFSEGVLHVSDTRSTASNRSIQLTDVF